MLAATGVLGLAAGCAAATSPGEGSGGSSGSGGSGTGGTGGTPADGGPPTCILLASKQTNGPHMIVTDGANVYWTNTGPSGNAVMSVPINGGPVLTMASSQSGADGIAVDTANVYWANNGDGTVRATPIGGGTVTTLATGQGCGTCNQGGPTGLAVAGGNVYWADAPEVTAGGKLMEVPVGGGTPIDLTEGTQEGMSEGVAVDSTNVYWVAGPTIQTMPLGGGAPKTLASGQSGWIWLVVAGGTVYWSNYYSSTPIGWASVSTNGGAVSTHANGENVAGIAVDSEFVYWADKTANAIMATPIASGPDSTVVSGQTGLYSIAVDANNIYWGDGTSIWQVAKPGAGVSVTCAPVDAGSTSTGSSSGSSDSCTANSQCSGCAQCLDGQCIACPIGSGGVCTC